MGVTVRVVHDIGLCKAGGIHVLSDLSHAHAFSLRSGMSVVSKPIRDKKTILVKQMVFKDVKTYFLHIRQTALVSVVRSATVASAAMNSDRIVRSEVLS